MYFNKNILIKIRVCHITILWTLVLCCILYKSFSSWQWPIKKRFFWSSTYAFRKWC